MTKRFLQKTGIVLSMLSVQQLSMAQLVSFAKPVEVSQSKQLGTRINAKSLKDCLADLGKQYQVSILYEEKNIINIMVRDQELPANANLEKKLADILKPYNLRFKKAGKRSLRNYP